MAATPEGLRTGRPAPSLYTNNFTRLDKKDNRSNRYEWKCIHCGDNPNSTGARIEGRDNNLPNHLSDTRKCPNAPLDVRNEALRFMVDKKRTSAPVAPTTSSGGMPQVATVIDVDATEGSVASELPRKKRRTIQGTLSSFVDQAMTETQKNSARFFIHANIAFRSAENPFLDDFLHDLRPTYDSPSRYALTHTVLDAEAACCWMVGRIA
ncbi:hypothetical protein C8R45DRAFT_1015958 [Mycena sanguinolenta]|nr:hypothetical protein C8R45DRAFT_1015900 [Mycena sanguinolenta]KAJ6470539.1 hypothetical protein C8R45DRAFT_1015958 [Mycena sanguinolenta]